MKNKKTNGLISLAVMVVLTLVLVFCSDPIYKALSSLNKGGKTEAVKTGMGFAITVNGSKDATAEKEGTAEADATVAAVTVDSNGKILSCVIDCAQTKINFSAAGLITTDATGEFLTKYEKKDKYNMGSISPIKKEWYEQADAFAAYCVGKTVSALKGADLATDLAASCTVGKDDMLAAVLNAVANAKDCGAAADDKLGLGVSTSISNSKDATAEEAGLAQAYTTFTVITVNADGKITSALIDAVQANVNFDATGKITSDLTVAPKTKNELKEGYGMAGISPIKKEWYEQAAAYAKFVVGRNAAGIKAIKVENGYAKEEDLAASCTIHVTDFNTVLLKAFDNAR